LRDDDKCENKGKDGKKKKRKQSKAKLKQKFKTKIQIRMSRGGGCGNWNMWEILSELNVNGRRKVTNDDKEYKGVRDGEKG